MQIFQLPVIESSLFSFQLEIQGTDTVRGERHFLEHMMLNSNKTYSKAELHRQLANLGGALFEARTSVERIMFSGTYLKKDQQKVWGVLRTILQECLFTEDEIKKEQKIITQEYHQSKDMIFSQLYKSLGQMLGANLEVCGELETINSISRTHLVELYGRIVHPGSVKLYVSNGEVPDDLLADKGGNSQVVSIVPSGSHFCKNVDMSSSVAMHAFEVNGDSQNGILLDEYLSSPVGPLFKNIREKKQLCYMVGSMRQFAGDELAAPYFTTYVVSRDKIDEANVALLEEFVVDDVELFDSLRKGYEIEVAKAKTSFNGWMALNRRSVLIGVPVSDFLSTIPTWDEFKKFAVSVREKHFGTFIVHGTKGE